MEFTQENQVKNSEASSYERPVIKRVENGVINKYGSTPAFARETLEQIDGVSIETMVQQYGSPLFVFSEQGLRDRYRDISNEFSTRYPDVVFGWSYKTNYLPAICAVLHQEGAIAEVVSEMEYEKARRLGVPGDEIIFNGPKKSRKILKRAVLEGAMIHVDHYNEILDLESIAVEMNRRIAIGIRINMDAGIQPQWTKFGFNLENQQALDIVERIREKRHLILRGIHCHIGTFITDPSAYSQQIKKMVQFKYQVENRFGYKIEYLDIGGGFPSMSKLKGTYHAPENVIEPISTYAEVICNTLLDELKPGDLPRLYIESGRAIVDEAGFLISTIYTSKRLPDGRKAYFADGGINLLFTAFWYSYRVSFDRELNGQDEPSVIFGPLCMNIDVVKDQLMLPDISDGTRVILSPVGAYNVTQWLQFIDYRPNIVMVSTESQVEIIRNAEDLSDITRREVLPDRLKLKGHMIPLYTHAGERNSAMEDTVPLESIRKQLFS